MAYTFFTTPEVAEILEVSQRTITNYCERRLIPYHRVSTIDPSNKGPRRILRQDLITFLGDLLEDPVFTETHREALEKYNIPYKTQQAA